MARPRLAAPCRPCRPRRPRRPCRRGRPARRLRAARRHRAAPPRCPDATTPAPVAGSLAAFASAPPAPALVPALAPALAPPRCGGALLPPRLCRLRRLLHRRRAALLARALAHGAHVALVRPAPHDQPRRLALRAPPARAAQAPPRERGAVRREGQRERKGAGGGRASVGGLFQGRQGSGDHGRQEIQHLPPATRSASAAVSKRRGPRVASAHD